MLRFEQLMRNLGATVENTGGGCKALSFYMHGHAFVACAELTVNFRAGDCDWPIGLGFYQNCEEYGWCQGDAVEYLETTSDLEALDTINRWIGEAREREKDLTDDIDEAMFTLWCLIAKRYGLSELNPEDIGKYSNDETLAALADHFTKIKGLLG